MGIYHSKCSNEIKTGRFNVFSANRPPRLLTVMYLVVWGCIVLSSIPLQAQPFVVAQSLDLNTLRYNEEWGQSNGYNVEVKAFDYAFSASQEIPSGWIIHTKKAGSGNDLR